MALRQALAQAWPPFVLVAGLLLIGLIGHVEGLFAWAASWLGRFGRRPRVLFVACCAVVAAVTAVLNLDTAVVFLTPVLVLTARRRGVEERPFLYAAIFLANASSLFLPGSNLTNLLIRAQEPVSGAKFAARMLAPAAAAVIATVVGLLLLYRSDLQGRSRGAPSARASVRAQAVPRAVLAVVAAAAVFTVALRQPAIPVLALGVAACAVEIRRGRLRPRAVSDALGLPVLTGLFALSVALGVVARTWHWPAHLLEHAGRAGTAAVGALSAVGINNLPAAVLLSAEHIAHPRALLLGLNVGPNLAVTGSLSAVLWFRAAKQVGAPPSAREFSHRGLVLAPAAVLLALSAITLFGSPS